VEVLPIACPGLVELVESGETETERTLEHLNHLLDPLRRTRVDTLVLGCTHYPFLRNAVARIMGPDVLLLDSGRAVARQLQRVLAERGGFASEGAPTLRFLTSGAAPEVGAVAARLWGEPLDVQEVAVPTLDLVTSR
jgi:glutamate racemase